MQSNPKMEFSTSQNFLVKTHVLQTFKLEESMNKQKSVSLLDC